eukprot:gene21420-28384_t
MSCHANPEDWVYAKATDCFMHPSGVEGRHRAPSDDIEASFNLVHQSTGNSISTVCPGDTYSVTVNFPSTSYAMMTLNYGIINDRQETSSCLNRDITPETTRETLGWTRSFTLACNATENVVVQVTRAASQRDAFLFTTVTLAVDPPCALATCSSTGGQSGGSTEEPQSAGPQTPLKPARPPPSSPPEPTPATLACEGSSLGYMCSRAFGDVRLHWTLNDTAPANDCTGTAQESASMDPAEGVLHMAVESVTTGYVGFSFSEDSAYMYPSEAVVGWVAPDGSATVASWYVSSYDSILGLGNTLLPSWAQAMGVSQANGATTICFSRMLTDINSQIYPTLPSDAAVQMGWAIGQNGQIDYEVHVRQGGIVMNLGSGSAEETSTSNREKAINIHGILMAVAWIFLLPLGSIIPRHRWLLQDRKLWGIHVWMRLHQWLQLAGMALFIAGFVYAFYEFPETPMGGDVGAAHKWLGIIVMAMAGLQVVAAFVRPDPKAAMRKYWSLMHHYLGRLSLISAWVTVYLGVYIYHENPVYQASYAQWMLPIVIVNGSIVAMDIAFTIHKRYALKDAPPTENGKAGMEKEANVLDFKAALELQQQEATQVLDPERLISSASARLSSRRQRPSANEARLSNSRI